MLEDHAGIGLKAALTCEDDFDLWKVAWATVQLLRCNLKFAEDVAFIMHKAETDDKVRDLMDHPVEVPDFNDLLK